jgi:hypothetical protein
MPAPILVGVGAVVAPEATAAAIAAAGVALRAALPFLFRTAVTAVRVDAVLNEAAKDKEEAVPATGASTTTIVGTKKMNCGDDGNYGDMLKKDGDGKLDRDHVPSKKALQEAAKDIIQSLDLDLTKVQLDKLFGDKGLISKQGQTIATPKKDHQQHSRTYGKRNNPDKVAGDSKDLQKAAENDTKDIEDAEGKEMDDECFKKYQKAAEKIRKKTHAEYVKDLTDLIKDVMKK